LEFLELHGLIEFFDGLQQKKFLLGRILHNLSDHVVLVLLFGSLVVVALFFQINFVLRLDHVSVESGLDDITLGKLFLGIPSNRVFSLLEMNLLIVDFFFIGLNLIKNILLIFTSNLFLLDLNVLFIGLKLQSLFDNFLFPVQELLVPLVFKSSFKLDQILALLLGFNLKVSLHLLKCSVFVINFNKLSLHIMEKSLRHNLHIRDFNGFEPDTPALADIFHFIKNSFSQHLSVFNNLINRRVGDSVSKNCFCHLNQDFISGSWLLTFEIGSETSVSSHWAIAFSVNAPHDHGTTPHTLHFLCDFTGLKVNFVNFGRELGNCIKGSFEKTQSNSGFFLLTIVEDNNKFICTSNNLEGSNIANQSTDQEGKVDCSNYPYKRRSDTH